MNFKFASLSVVLVAVLFVISCSRYAEYEPMSSLDLTGDWISPYNGEGYRISLTQTQARVVGNGYCFADFGSFHFPIHGAVHEDMLELVFGYGFSLGRHETNQFRLVRTDDELRLPVLVGHVNTFRRHLFRVDDYFPLFRQEDEADLPWPIITERTSPFRRDSSHTGASHYPTNAVILTIPKINLPERKP